LRRSANAIANVATIGAFLRQPTPRPYDSVVIDRDGESAVGFSFERWELIDALIIEESYRWLLDCRSRDLTISFR
jgi:hypothetical protein